MKLEWVGEAGGFIEAAICYTDDVCYPVTLTLTLARAAGHTLYPYP